MTNSKHVPKNTKKFQKIQKFPKKFKFSKKAKKSQKSQNLTTKAKICIFFFFFLEIWPFFWLFLKNLANFGFIMALLEIFGFHVAYIGGTYRLQKSDVDDSVEGTEKAM
jgi:hypothetical protein